MLLSVLECEYDAMASIYRTAIVVAAFFYSFGFFFAWFGVHFSLRCSKCGAVLRSFSRSYSFSISFAFSFSRPFMCTLCLRFISVQIQLYSMRTGSCQTFSRSEFLGVVIHFNTQHIHNFAYRSRNERR